MDTKEVEQVMKEVDEATEVKEDYYKDHSFVSFSSIKVFSRCETLYRDLYITKTYEEPDHDYFTYGKLVDAMTTEPEEFITANFVRVARKVKPEDALKIENDIKEVQKEIRTQESKLEEGKSEKQQVFFDKIKVIEDKIAKARKKDGKFDVKKDLEKITELNTKAKEVPGNKVIEKGIISRNGKIEELQQKLDHIKELADKIQVTESIWQNAEETAQSIKSHPAYSSMEFNQATSQQVFRTTVNGVPRKGKLDHLKLSPSLTRFYAIYAAEQMTVEELRQRIQNEVHEQDRWAIITDIKTCYSIEKLEPYNAHYRGQLGFYQDLVSNVLHIPIQNIKCRILVADKLSNDYKKCELFEYDQSALDELKPDVEAWAQMWKQRIDSGTYISAKEKHGLNQKCFTCSECRFCPFSVKPGEPVPVTGPRFAKNGEDAQIIADQVVDELTQPQTSQE